MPEKEISNVRFGRKIMKRIGKSIVILLLGAMLVCPALLTGCRKSVNGEPVAVIVEKEMIPLSEAELYFYDTQYEIELVNDSMTGVMFKTIEDYWKITYKDGSTIGDCRASAMSTLVETKILCQQAEKDGISLTQEETDSLRIEVNRFMKEKKTVAEAAEASREVVEKYLRDTMLADKERDYLTRDIDQTFDEDVVRRKRVSGLSAMAGTDANGNPLPVEEQKKLIDEAAADMLARYQAGEDKASICASYQDRTDVQIYELGEQIEIVKPEDYDPDGPFDSYEKLGWSMSTGEIRSSCFINKANNYVCFLFECLDDDDQELRKAAEDQIMTKRRDERFQEVYEELKDGYKVSVENKTTDALTVTATLYSGE